MQSHRRRYRGLKGARSTLLGRQNQILLKRQSHHANMIWRCFEEVYAWEELARIRKLGDNQRRGNRAFHHGYPPSLRFANCWLLNAIFPSSLQIYTSGEQEV